MTRTLLPASGTPVATPAGECKLVLMKEGREFSGDGGRKRRHVGIYGDRSTKRLFDDDNAGEE